MSNNSDPDIGKSPERARALDDTYGDLGRKTVVGTGATVSHAESFTNAIERLQISSLPPIALIPRNLESSPDVDHLIYERESRELQVLGNQLGLSIVPLTGSEVITVHENDASIILASLFIAYEAIEKLNGLATLVEFFTNISKHFGSRRSDDGMEVELSQEIIVRKHSTTKRLSYKGPASGLPEIVRLIRYEFESNDTP